MKKQFLALALAMNASSAVAAYTDYGYTEYDLKDDARLLAQASLLLKGSDRSAASEATDEKLKKTIKRQCKGIGIKWRKTDSPTAEMRSIKRKIDGICDQWGF